MATQLKPVEQANTSGIVPLDLRVLVLPDAAETVTPGGIIIPPSKVDEKTMAMTMGTIVAAGENAWEEASARSPHFCKPIPGDRIVFAKYGGIVIKGRDGAEYRLLNDEDVIAREQ